MQAVGLAISPAIIPRAGALQGASLARNPSDCARIEMKKGPPNRDPCR